MNKEQVDNKTIASNITSKERERAITNDNNIMKEQPTKNSSV